jgi:hypothetical protein
MTTICKTYSSEVVARHAVDVLRAAGVPGRDIRLLTGCCMHDVRREPAGGFAGAVGPDATVRTYANTRCLRRQGAGSFAGDPDRQRQGSFADADRDVIVSFEDGAEHPRLVGDHAVRQLLRAVAVDPAGPVVEELHAGHAVVIAEIAAIAPREARSRLEEVAKAA